MKCCGMKCCGMTAPGRRIAALAVATMLLHLVLIQPNHPAAMTFGALFVFPIELPALIGLLMALSGRSRVTTVLRMVLVAVLMAIAVLKLADYASFVAFNRGFNLLVDLHLAEAALRLSSGAIGLAPTILALAGGLAALAAAAASLWWATGRWAAVAPPGALRAGAVALCLLATGAGVAEVGQALGAWRLPATPPGAAFTARVGYERVATYRDTLRDLRTFDRAAGTDPYAGTRPLLDRIAGHDVLIVFVESYGRASFDNPLYASTHLTTLAEAGDRLSEAGLAMRSGWLTAPMIGGQSWLAHATLATGLPITNQTRYGAALRSPRLSLFHLAGAAGFETAAVMPAITLAWPEAAFMGFETIHAARDLGYRGQPFNWVTMPDQFTLSFVERTLRGGDRARPVFAQVALISSHAPWVPIPPLIDWDAIGDGAVFDRWATSGDPPEVVWRDRDRVRDQYRLAVDYSLRAVGEFALRQAGDPALLIVLGDHQSARFVSQSDSFDVPVHIIGPPDLVAMTEEWNWAEGLLPGDDTPVWPMAAFRDRFLAAFSSAGPGL